VSSFTLCIVTHLVSLSLSVNHEARLEDELTFDHLEFNSMKRRKLWCHIYGCASPSPLFLLLLSQHLCSCPSGRQEFSLFHPLLLLVSLLVAQCYGTVFVSALLLSPSPLCPVVFCPPVGGCRSPEPGGLSPCWLRCLLFCITFLSSSCLMSI
jgi:hypothetical protein